MNAFYAEIDKLRRPDPEGKDGVESNTKLASRLGVTASHLTRWKQGVRPEVEQIQRIVVAAGLPASEVWRLLSVSLRDALPPGFPGLEQTKMPVYVHGASVASLDETSEADYWVAVGGDLVESLGITGNMVGFELASDDYTMGFAVPAGTLAYVERVQHPGFVLDSGAVYLVADQDGRLCVRHVVQIGGGLRFVCSNTDYRDVVAWTDDLSKLILGRVIGYRGIIKNLRATVHHRNDIIEGLTWDHSLRRIWHLKADGEEGCAFLERAGVTLDEFHAWVEEPSLDLPARRVETIIRRLNVPNHLVDWLRVGEAPPPQNAKKKGER